MPWLIQENLARAVQHRCDQLRRIDAFIPNPSETSCRKYSSGLPPESVYLFSEEEKRGCGVLYTRPGQKMWICCSEPDLSLEQMTV